MRNGGAKPWRAATLVALSAFSFPGIPLCDNTQQRVKLKCALSRRKSFYLSLYIMWLSALWLFCEMACSTLKESMKLTELFQCNSFMTPMASNNAQASAEKIDVLAGSLCHWFVQIRDKNAGPDGRWMILSHLCRGEYACWRTYQSCVENFGWLDLWMNSC